jgi:hypothetical protein
MNVYYQPPNQGWIGMVLADDSSQFSPEQVLTKWDGFVSPEGDFYGTRPTGFPEWNGIRDCHEYFASTVVACGSRQSCKGALVFDGGWVSCTFAVTSYMARIPTRDIVGPVTITDAQRETILAILAAREIDPSTITGGVNLE